MPAEAPSRQASGHAQGHALARSLCRAPQALLIGVVRGYRLLLKPWLGNACRFEPTCSAYTLQALQQHGAVGGSLLGGARLLRCHPWCEGGLDPVPEDARAVLSLRLRSAGLFTRWLAPGTAGRTAASPESDIPARSETP